MLNASSEVILSSPAQALTSQSYIPALAANWLVSKLQGLGLSPEGLFCGIEIKAHSPDNRHSTISVQDYLKLIENALNLTGDASLGLKIGAQQILPEYGPWGYTLMSSSTPQQALASASKYWSLIGALVNYDCAINGDTLTMEIKHAYKIDQEPLQIFTIERHIAGARSIFRGLTGQDPKLTHLELTYSKPKHSALYSEFCATKVQFNARSNRLVMSNPLLQKASLSAHTELKSLCEQQCWALSQTTSSDQQLKTLIRQFMLTSQDYSPKATAIALYLHISVRTLFRRLKTQKLSYQKVVDGVRLEISREFLEASNLSIDQIAEKLGFMDTSSFRKSFKKWTGSSPSQIRNATLSKTDNSKKIA